ncbi:MULTISPECIES: carotenoid oxygenase family protein [unclassified Leptolyngbya]|uniref:carotenoid oxygenase family protein n=1 Tax=unclassified Leptolyngbya TaxID=2650499 RepID=UPI001685B7EB|nr:MULTISPECIES: carotenoid oxygenase family protein [unclassified Leptolyngbya]MBD1909391.1 carotenoid oxygenase family protein [Leptolyngbya sp. FACHB-8]MBD2157108.1 carotenoid oxygenase family protein [Leptolyngbya sp. FACHB-16]
MAIAPYQLGFSAAHQEGEFNALPIQGTIPSWLRGSLIRTGPGTLEVGQQSYHHWFDGLAMLRKFSFEDGRVSFANRFLESQAYREAKSKGKISRGEFGTTARHSFLERLTDPLPRLTDNATVNITMQGDRFVSVTESPFPIIFDPQSLNTIDQFHYHDHVPGQITTAHPHFDYRENAVYSYLVNLIPRCSYSIYRMDAHSNERTLIGSIPVKQPAYMHTFSMTEHYIILSEYPLKLNRLSLMLSGKPYIENYQWKSDKQTRFLIISKETGEVVHSAESEPFFSFHHVNAFEQNGEVVVDLIAYSDSAVIQSLYLESLLEHPEQVIAAGELRRYRIPLNEAIAHFEVLTSEPVELPRINYQRCNTRPYQFVYGVGSSRSGNFIDQLVKVDIQNRTTQIWRSPDCYPGEPVFVAAPNTTSEDEGVILSVVLNAQTQNSFLLVLDAQSWNELARVELPYHLPFDFHGQYFDAIVPTERTQLHR